MHHWPAITESVHAQMLSDSRVPSYNLCNIQKEVEGECKRAWNMKCYSDQGCYSDTLITVDCEEENNRARDLQTYVIQCFDNSECTTATCLQKKFVDRHPSRRCVDCDGPVDQITRFEVIPKVLVFAINHESVKVSKKNVFVMESLLLCLG